MLLAEPESEPKPQSGFRKSPQTPKQAKQILRTSMVGECLSHTVEHSQNTSNRAQPLLYEPRPLTVLTDSTAEPPWTGSALPTHCNPSE